MKIEVIVPERLLNHQKLEFVELLEMLDVIERVSRVGIATQQYLWPALADTLENAKVPARFALQLDALITGV